MIPTRITPFSHPLNYAKPIFLKTTFLTISFGAFYKAYNILSTTNLTPEALEAWNMKKKEIELRNNGY